MVRILANGEIVQDDDLRVRRTPASSTSRIGGVNRDEQQEGNYRQNDAYQGGPTIFDTWNQKLLQVGIPRWNIGSHTVEPIMTVAALLVLIFVGLPGLLFLGLLYFVVKSSQQRTDNAPPRSRGPSGGPGRGQTGGGRRLGR
ncbi:unnamed protein product [Clavelina lepadiformis]|uniref:DUF4605 domain-containing protein n=1 Tax=Clavelina lepadiformis TaxID=159417 RepID=A0ABP0EV14_CLALP